jgi:steroid 5-alpha reductase family enzyme
VLIGLEAVIALGLLLWLVSLAIGDASIVDIAWGPLIFLIGLAYFLATNGDGVRGRLMLGAVALWAVRLAWHIGRRNLGHGEDFRYAAWRRQYGARWWWFSYFKVFLLQGVIAWIISLPLFYAITSEVPTHLTMWDWAGAGLFAAGFLFEAIGDEQLRRFKADARNQGRVLDTGLWRYTRHPNYFGEAVLWWGLGLIGAATPLGWIGLAGPAIMTFLLIRVSGVAMLETTLKQTKPAYANYIETTSAFVPLPPRRSDLSGPPTTI